MWSTQSNQEQNEVGQAIENGSCKVLGMIKGSLRYGLGMLCILNATTSNQRAEAAVTHDLVYSHRLLFAGSVENRFIGRRKLQW